MYAPAMLFAQCWDKVYTADDYTVGKKLNGTYWVWGRNEGAVYGDGSNVESHVPVMLAVQDIDMLACGVSHMVALKPDGTLWGWGSNLYGQLGQGNTSDALFTPVQIGTDADWEAVFPGWIATFAIKSDGSLWGCGSNFFGELGIGTTGSFQFDLTRIGTDNDWVFVDGGTRSTYAIKSNGTLWAMGNNDHGQLGDGTLIMQNEPVQVGSDSNWVKVEGGNVCAIGLKNDGSMWSWGSDDFASNDNILSVPTQIPGEWLDISGNNLFALALKTDNTLWGWGRNGDNALNSNLPLQYLPIQISPDSDWVSISAGGAHSAAIKADNSLWTCGSNIHGQIGNGTNTGNDSATNSVYPFETVSCQALSSGELALPNSISIFPNPIKSTLNIETDIAINSITVFDLAGRKVLTIKNSNHSMPMDDLDQGVYILHVHSEKGTHVYKIAKE